MTSDAITAQGMEQLIRDYFDACNTGDPDLIAAHFMADAVHYFPPGMYDGPFRGARAIASRWQQSVERLGSVWTVDQVITHPPSARAVIEWTHFKTYQRTVLRGDEWYEFDRATGLIAEIRAYYASPQAANLERLELGGYDYTERGYPTVAPIVRTRPQS